MKKSIGSIAVLYPLPVTVVGAMKPVLFDFSNDEYLQTGDVPGKCLSFRQKA